MQIFHHDTDISIHINTSNRYIQILINFPTSYRRFNQQMLRKNRAQTD